MFYIREHLRLENDENYVGMLRTKKNTPASEHRLAAWEDHPGLPQTI
jgi:hypothetical protein